MKHLFKRILTASAAFAFACIPALTANITADYAPISVDAAVTTTATGYTKTSDVKYSTSGSYVYNWGARGEECGFLSPKAVDFYTGSNTYEVFSQKSGGTTQSNASSSALYSALKTFMKSKHKTETSYQGTRDLYKYTDCTNGSNKISSFYSGKEIGPAWDSGSTWNREHTWPNSKGLGGNDENDIMMLRPTWVQENSSRGNTAYGQSSGYYDPNGEGANVRGDCARIILYVYTRWGNTSYMWGSSGVMESMDVLLKWMEEDPVDTWEMGRNDAVQSITGTRNVFVDYPEFAFLLFGKTAPKTMVTPSGIASDGTAVPTPPPVTPDEPDTPDVPDTPDLPAANSQISIAKALEIGSAMDHNTTTSEKYYVTGKITEVSNTTYGNMTIEDESGNSIFVYGTWSGDGKTRYDGISYPPTVGATVTLYTVIGNYNGAQLKDAWMHGVQAGATPPVVPDEPDTPDVPDTPDTPNTPISGAIATFEFGDNTSGGHVDNGTPSATKTYTENGYTLNITDGANLYAECYDEKGNSCLKLGSGSNTGSFSFTVPNDVVSVVFSVAKYKSKASAFTLNGKNYTPTTNSNDGQYTNFAVDTSSVKSITVATTNDGKRIMIDSISFFVAEEPDTPTTPDIPDTPDNPDTGDSAECNHEFGEWSVRREPTATVTGLKTRTCNKCGAVEREVIPVISGDDITPELPNLDEEQISNIVANGCAASVTAPTAVVLLISTVLFKKKKD